LYYTSGLSNQNGEIFGLTVFLAFYSFLVGSAALTDIRYQKELNTFDLNKDGLFSGNDITPEQEAAMFRLTNDVGRNFTVFTGVFFGGIFGLFAYLITWGFDKYKKLRIEEKTKHNTKYKQ
jgi:hypothetical protein